MAASPCGNHLAREGRLARASALPAVLDRADTINDLPGMIKFKRQLGQAFKIAVWMRPHHKRNLRFATAYVGFVGMFILSVPAAATSFLVAVPRARDLLFSAKHLFGAPERCAFSTMSHATL